MTQYLGGPFYILKSMAILCCGLDIYLLKLHLERAKAWLSCMYQAMDEVGLEGEIRSFSITASI